MTKQRVQLNMNILVNPKKTTQSPTILQKTEGTPAEQPAVIDNESQTVGTIPTETENHKPRFFEKPRKLPK